MNKKEKKTVKKRYTDFRYNEDDERSILEDILSFISTFIICTLVIVIVSFFVIKPANISGRSMAPNLKNGQRGFSSIVSLMLEGIQRYDVVLAKTTDDNGQEATIIKRVIALPGETISCKNEIVYVNGKPLDERRYLNSSYHDEWLKKNKYFNYDFKEVTLKDNEYFLMGDNRPISLDSRDLGPFKENQIIAKDFFVVYPFDQAGYIHQ